LIDASRRQFLQVGIAGAIVLATVPVMMRPRASTAALIGALAPVVLAGALPVEPGARAEALREVLGAFERAVAELSPATQEALGDLLGLLAFAPTRILFTGLPAPLERCTPDQIAAFLGRWRRSNFDLLRAGYQALTQLIQAAWYDNRASWAAIGYPGPPALAGRGPQP
jgi:hypothetical protein